MFKVLGSTGNKECLLALHELLGEPLELDDNLLVMVVQGIASNPQASDKPSIKEGKAIEVSPENVKFSNSLQISESLKYIYSDKNDFKLAEEMLGKNPDLGNGKVIWMGI